MSIERLLEERQALRTKVIRLFGNYQYEGSIIPIK